MGSLMKLSRVFVVTYICVGPMLQMSPIDVDLDVEYLSLQGRARAGQDLA